jgi:hypothetical protein
MNPLTSVMADDFNTSVHRIQTMRRRNSRRNTGKEEQKDSVSLHRPLKSEHLSEVSTQYQFYFQGFPWSHRYVEIRSHSAVETISLARQVMAVVDK